MYQYPSFVSAFHIFTKMKVILLLLLEMRVSENKARFEHLIDRRYFDVHITCNQNICFCIIIIFLDCLGFDHTISCIIWNVSRHSGVTPGLSMHRHVVNSEHCYNLICWKVEKLLSVPGGNRHCWGLLQSGS